MLTAKAKEAKICVADTAYMRSSHMHLLDDWRQTVVRDGERYMTTSDGKVYYKEPAGDLPGMPLEQDASSVISATITWTCSLTAGTAILYRRRVSDGC